MKTMMGILVFFGAILNSASSFADGPALDLPTPMIQMLETAARQGTCEARWKDIATQVGVVTQQMTSDMTLYLVPCALWAHNLAWTAFVIQQEPSHPDGFLTLALRFVDYSATEGLVAKDVIHNVQWNSETRTLRARFYLNGKEECGSASEYKWSSDQRGLLLSTLIKQDDCKASSGPWSLVYSRN